MARLMTVAALGTLISAGCGPSSATDDARGELELPSAPDLSAAPSELPAIDDPPQAEVELLDPGAEPRQLLEYRPRVGSQQTVAMTSLIDMEIVAGEHRLFREETEMTLALRFRVEEVTADGDIEVGVQVVDVEVPAFGRPGVAAQYTGLIGEASRLTVSRRGRVVEQDFSMFENADAARWLLDADYFMLALPDQPVGEGASWRVRTAMLQEGMTMDSITTHELVELTRDRLVTSADAAYDVAPQVVPSMRRTPVGRHEIVTTSSDGAGEYSVALSEMIPSSHVRFDLESRMRFRGPHGAQESTFTMRAETHIEDR